MNNYDFKKLTKEQKLEESKKVWVQTNPEEYIRLLIINDEIELLKKIEKESLYFDFSYRLKDEVLLTLAMEKQSFKMIDYFLSKGLSVKFRDVEGLVKNFREEENKDFFLEVLEKVNLDKFDINQLLNNLSDYYYEDNIVVFIDYILEKDFKINQENYQKLKEEESFAFVIDKYEKRKHFESLNFQYPNKEKGKSNKI